MDHSHDTFLPRAFIPSDDNAYGLGNLETGARLAVSSSRDAPGYSDAIRSQLVDAMTRCMEYTRGWRHMPFHELLKDTVRRNLGTLVAWARHRDVFERVFNEGYVTKLGLTMGNVAQIGRQPWKDELLNNMVFDQDLMDRSCFTSGNGNRLVNNFSRCAHLSQRSISARGQHAFFVWSSVEDKISSWQCYDDL